MTELSLQNFLLNLKFLTVLKKIFSERSKKHVNVPIFAKIFKIENHQIILLFIINS